MKDINNITINRRLDYKKTSLEDRKEVIDEILNETEDKYREYFSKKPVKKSSDILSEQDNVCRALENMATYLLNSDESKEMDKKNETKYIFVNDPKYFEKKVNREVSLEGLMTLRSAEGSGEFETEILFLEKEANDYIIKNQSIKASDLKRDDWLGEILRDYKKLEDFTTKELKKKNSKYNRYLLTNTKGQVNQDMAYVKDSLLGVFGYESKAITNSKSKPNYDVFDFTNKDHLLGKSVTFVNTKTGKETRVVAKGLLYFTPTDDLDDEFNLVLLELQDIIMQTKPTYEDLMILKLMREGLTQGRIAEEIGTHQVFVSRSIQGLTKRIMKKAKEIEKENVKK